MRYARKAILTRKGHFWQNKEIYAIQVVRVGLAQHGLGTSEVVVDVADLGGELEAGNSHEGRRGATKESETGAPACE